MKVNSVEYNCNCAGLEIVCFVLNLCVLFTNKFSNMLIVRSVRSF